MTRRILPQHEQFAYRLAALSDMAPPTTAVSKDFLNQLEQEYKQWIGSKTMKPVVKAEDFDKAENVWTAPEFPHDGSIGHWPNVEKFLKENYPASHRDFQMGLEEARPLVRGEPNTLETDFSSWWDDWQHKKDYDSVPEYETGPEAVEKHGYDPRHVAAGMVLLHCLHNGAWSDRDMEIADDIDMLEKLFDTRVEMQRKTDERQKAAYRTAMPAVDAYDTFNRSPRVPFPEVPRTKWYHASPHLLPDDTILTPGGGKSPWGKNIYDYHGGWAERANWVWLTDNLPDAKTWGKLIYEVEPLDEGPWPWNGPDGESHHVTPRARIIRRLPHAEVFPEHGDCGCERYLEKVAMPVPTTVPKTRNQWVKERARLRKLVEKHGLPLDIVPNYDPDWSNQVYDQNWRWQHLRGGRGSPYADRIERDRTPGIVYRQRVVELGDKKIPINYLIHNNDDGNITGILSHYPEGSPYEKPGAVTVTVNPQLTGEGIGTKLMQEAIDRFGVDLESQQYTPYGYELYRKMKRERGEEVPDIFGAEKEKAMRNRVAASVPDQTIKRLEKEFNEWWAGTGREASDIDYVRSWHTDDGPITDWPTIEEFLAEKYPAAQRDDNYMGWEQAHPLLERSLHPEPDDDEEYAFATEPYETGPEAVATHGYDPAEVIAGMLYLHNKSHPWRTELLRSDRQRIMDVVKARRKMQKAYDAQQRELAKTAAKGEDLYVKAASVLRFAYRVLGADGEAHLWGRERARLIQKGIPLDELNRLHTEWVLTTKPINPATGQPHTPGSARSHWVSGWVPFLAAYFPTASTQRNMFDKVQGHDKAVNEVLIDLIRDDGNLDRLTAGAMALHSMENGNFGLYNKILHLDPDLKKRTQDMKDWFAKGYSVDTSTGMPVNPAPAVQPQQAPIQPSRTPVMQPSPMAQPADTTPKPSPMPQPNPMPRQQPQMSESDMIRLELQRARAASRKSAQGNSWRELDEGAQVSTIDHLIDRSGRGGKKFHIPTATFSTAEAAGHFETMPDGSTRSDPTAHQRVLSGEAEQYVNDILRSKGWTRGHVKVEPEHWDLRERGSGAAMYSRTYNTIGLAGNHTNEIELLHEVAHALTDTPGHNYHGPDYQKVMYGLLRERLPKAAEMYAQLVGDLMGTTLVEQA